MSSSGAYLASGFAVSEHDLEAAARLMSVVLRQDPGNARLLHRTFVLALGGGDIDLASSLADRVLTVDPEDQLAGLLLVLDDVEGDRLQPALDRLLTLERDGVGRFILPIVEAWLRAGLADRGGAVGALTADLALPGFAPPALLPHGSARTRKRLGEEK